ncbi:unnamed protein product [Oppiella nova]|uniref:SMP-30/Gluconolactonase/LRE-like region domain-containing protein n=1 Tax=Oppiella nova TaxID=334625 RepID=A0A7R9LDB4_9ACAR|nr:unnamed protein product [Oppiella nova]CAG2162323.1 unnamed protein product [Oppiella nova]
MSFRVEPLGENGYNLGEGPHWDSERKKLYFVDAFVGDVLAMDVSTGRTDKTSFKDLVTIVIPFEENNDILLVSLRNKVLKWDTKANTREVIARIAPELEGKERFNDGKVIAPELEGKERFNDGKVDALGRLWIGSVLDGPNGAVPQKGSLYKLFANNFVKMSDNITLSNGMTWNLYNTKMYFNDSGDQKIYVFDFDLQNGLLHNKKVFVDFKCNPDFKSDEYPDGMTTDKSGRLWVSLYGGGRVVQINEESGSVENYVSIPALLTTSIAFGGQELDQMFVTTGDDKQDLNEYPNAGKIFRVTSSDHTFRGNKIETNFRPNV